MDKYGVVTQTENDKIAAKSGRPCPGCGSNNVNYKGMVPHCPKCGTRPWEQQRGSKEEGRR